MMPQGIDGVKKSFCSDMNWVEPLRNWVYKRREDEKVMVQCISRWNQRMRMFVLVLGAFCACMLFPLSEVEASGSSVFEVPEAVEEKEGETITLDFASLGEEKADWGYSHVVGDKFRVFVRDQKVAKDWFFGLPEKISGKSNWEVTIVVNQFEFESIGITFGGYFNGPILRGRQVYDGDRAFTHCSVMLPLNGGRCVVRHAYPEGFFTHPGQKRVVDIIDTGFAMKKNQYPVKIQYVYNGLEQECIVLLNGQKTASYTFASFKNRLPWNITHIGPVIVTGDKFPVRMELESKFTVRAW